MLDTGTLRVAFGVVTVTVFALFSFATFRHTRSAYSAWWCAPLILFSTGSAAYLFDGTIHQRWANPLKHGGIDLTRAQKSWLKENGWTLP